MFQQHIFNAIVKMVLEFQIIVRPISINFLFDVLICVPFYELFMKKSKESLSMNKRLKIIVNILVEKFSTLPFL